MQFQGDSHAGPSSCCPNHTWGLERTKVGVRRRIRPACCRCSAAGAAIAKGAVVPCDHGKGWHECIEHENHPFYGSAEQVNVAGSLPSTCQSYPPVDEHGASRYRDVIDNEGMVIFHPKTGTDHPRP
jgi:hypothetical protein